MTETSKKIFWGTAGTLVAIFPAILLAHVEGPDARHSGAPGDAQFSCADAGECHSTRPAGGPVNSTSPGGSVTATFSTGSSYTPGGAAITITVNVTDASTTWTGHFGFQMSARLDSDQISGQAGHFVPGDPDHQLVMCDYASVQFMDTPEGPDGCGPDMNGNPSVEFIEHSFPKNTPAQTTPYTFTWIPPSTAVGPVHFYVAGNAVNNDTLAGSQDHVYTKSYVLTPAAPLPPPTIVSGGVLNAASFAKSKPVAPGSLVAIFGSNLGGSQADASTVPFPTTLGGVSVTFGNVPAAMRDVIPAAQIVNVQVPFEVPVGTQNAVVTVNGVASPAEPVQIVREAPGIFTIPSGVGNAVLVNLTLNDGFSIAAPVGKIPGLTTHPIARGTKAFFYATGLGIMTPSVSDGDAGGSATHTVAATPVVLVGGITAPVEFAGQAPGYPGVYQVNITIPQTAPTGSAVDLQIQSADGTILSAPKISTIAIQ